MRSKVAGKAESHKTRKHDHSISYAVDFLVLSSRTHSNPTKMKTKRKKKCHTFSSKKQESSHKACGALYFFLSIPIVACRFSFLDSTNQNHI